MSKKRKVGNLLALAVLATLIPKPMHPYEIASFLRETGKDRDMPFKWGSLYTVVNNLEKHGFVAAERSERQGGRPERTVYRITGAGRAELDDWLRELVAVPEPEIPRFRSALSVLGVLPPDEVIELLGRRLAALDEELAAARANLAEALTAVPRLFLVEVEYDLALRAAEADWVRGLHAELAGGTMPGLDGWREWHRTGGPPPDWTDVAEGRT
jgi:DNA-binding PadR family transcriptional regulator